MAGQYNTEREFDARSRIQEAFVHWIETVHIAGHVVVNVVVGVVVATQAAKDGAAAAVGRLVCAIVVEKIVARAYVENEMEGVAGYMEGVLNEMVQEDCCMLHPHLGQARSGVVGTIAALGCTEFGVLALMVDWEAVVVSFAVVGDKRC